MMDPITGMLISSVAAPMISKLFGGGESSAERAQGDLTGQMARMYKQYGPQVFSMLMGIAQDPSKDPWYAAQSANTEAAIGQDYNAAAGDAMMRYQMAGGGRPGDSSGANALLLAMAKARGSAMGQFRTGQLGDQFTRKQNALSQMLGGISGTGQTAIGSYGNLSATQNARNDAQGQWANQLGYLLGQMGGSGGSGGGGGGAGGLGYAPSGNAAGSIIGGTLGNIISGGGTPSYLAAY